MGRDKYTHHFFLGTKLSDQVIFYNFVHINKAI